MKKLNIAIVILAALFISVGFVRNDRGAEAAETNPPQQTGLRVGDIAPELNFKNPAGEYISLKSLRGHYVLIDFWASWCGPCRRESPTLVQAYSKYKNSNFTGAKGKGLKIYSVSLDRDPSAWTNAISQDRLEWAEHVSDLKFWNSEAAKIYQVNSIPASFLIDPNGKIIAQNLRGGNLLLELDKHVAQ